jgi:hypothetical protein
VSLLREVVPKQTKHTSPPSILSSICEEEEEGGLTKRRKVVGPYTVGDVNYAIDAAVHPLFRLSPAFRLLDGLLHAMNERSPRSLKKFLKYHGPALLGGVAKRCRLHREGEEA